jgi:hypothetical protein
VFGWLAGFDGDTWEQRWIASGADAAPRGWVEHAKKWQRYAAVGGVYHLVQARVLRPSYAWLMLCRAGNALTRFLETNAANHMAGLRALPAYQQALPRHRADAEHCLARVMIRTGKSLDGLTGDELLHYADIVRTSGRHRREHLAWELMVALGVFAGEAATLRAAWSAKGNTRQHSVATLVDRYGIPPSGVRDLLVDYLGELHRDAVGLWPGPAATADRISDGRKRAQAVHSPASAAVSDPTKITIVAAVRRQKVIGGS